MKKYGVTFNNGDGTILVEASFFSIDSGFICFYIDSDFNGTYISSAYSADSVFHCVEQNEYTESEILNEIETAS